MYIVLYFIIQNTHRYCRLYFFACVLCRIVSVRARADKFLCCIGALCSFRTWKSNNMSDTERICDVCLWTEFQCEGFPNDRCMENNKWQNRVEARAQVPYAITTRPSVRLHFYFQPNTTRFCVAHLEATISGISHAWFSLLAFYCISSELRWNARAVSFVFMCSAFSIFLPLLSL